MCSLSLVETFQDVLTEMASIVVPPEDVDKKVAQLLVSIKNVMTDRGVTNKSFVIQFQAWRSDVLPLVIQNYADLPDAQKISLARMNHVFCGIHVIHNLGIYLETATKEWVKIASLTEKHGGFLTNNSRVYDLLYEILKLRCYTHGDQRSGKAAEWKAYLTKLEEESHIMSFLHHRFNIFFVLGGAAYYHRHHIKDFLSKLDSTNFLHMSVATEIDNPIYLAGF